jgi:hypothetical protein
MCLRYDWFFNLIFYVCIPGTESDRTLEIAGGRARAASTFAENSASEQQPNNALRGEVLLTLCRGASEEFSWGRLKRIDPGWHPLIGCQPLEGSSAYTHVLSSNARIMRQWVAIRLRRMARVRLPDSGVYTPGRGFASGHRVSERVACRIHGLAG